MGRWGEKWPANTRHDTAGEGAAVPAAGVAAGDVELTVAGSARTRTAPQKARQRKKVRTMNLVRVIFAFGDRLRCLVRQLVAGFQGPEYSRSDFGTGGDPIHRVTGGQESTVECIGAFANQCFVIFAHEP